MRDSGIRFVGYANLISIAPGGDGGGGERGDSVCLKGRVRLLLLVF